MIFLLPGTYADVLLEQRNRRAGIEPIRRSFKGQYATNLTRPVCNTFLLLPTLDVPLNKFYQVLGMSRLWLMLFTEPILFALSLYSAFVWGILYLDFTAYPVVFQQARHWKQGVAGLSFLGIGLGMAIATASSPWINDIHGVYVEKLGGLKPEVRLPHLIYIAWPIPAALFWVGWSSLPPTHWAVCITSGIPFGIGFVTLFLGTNAYLTDCYGRFSASALAANAVLRSLFTAVFPLFARQMYVKLGAPWASSLLGFIALAMALLPWLSYTYGPGLRTMSKYHLKTMELERDTDDFA